MFRKAKLIKLPKPLIDYCIKEFKSHFAYLFKANITLKDNLDAQDLEFLANNEKVFKEFYNARPSTPNKKELWDNYVDAADSIKGYEPKIFTFSEYEFMTTSAGNKNFQTLKDHCMEILGQQKKLVSYFNDLDRYPEITATFNLPHPHRATSQICESKPFDLQPRHLIGMPYVTTLPKQYTFKVLTQVLDNSDADAKMFFYPNTNQFVVKYYLTRETLSENPLYYLEKADEITEHELTHFVQYLMKDITSAKSWGDVGKIKGNTSWQDLPIEYKAILRDQFVRLNKMKSLSMLDLSSYKSFIQSINHNLQYLPQIEDIKKDSPEKFTPFMIELFKLLRK